MQEWAIKSLLEEEPVVGLRGGCRDFEGLEKFEEKTHFEAASKYAPSKSVSTTYNQIMAGGTTVTGFILRTLFG